MSERTTAELERDAEAARARVADTADSIRSKMSPGQLIDEFTGIFSGGDGSAALANLKAQVSANPLALGLIGSGLAWLMFGQGASGSSPPSSVPSSSRPEYSGSGNPAWDGADTGSFADRGSEAMGGVTSTVRTSAHAVGDTISEGASAVGSIASEALQKVRDGVGSSSEWAKSTANGVTSGAGDFAAKARRSAGELIENEPLIIAALGFAVGTAIGALLPRTTVEDEHLGAYSDHMRDGAKDLMDKGVEAAKEVAADTYQAVKEEADRQGLKPTGDRSSVNKVTEVVRATTARAEDAIRDKISTHDG